MRIHVLALFPEILGGALATGVLGRARERGLIEVFLHQLRDYARDSHARVDDVPYGGGQGMIMKPEPLVAALEHAGAADAPRRILLSPKGILFSHERACALARERALLIICGRYEGVDERITTSIDEELSIGDYVLSGGEPAALVVIDALVRLLPGAVGNQASPLEDSHASGLLEYPQYTRPEVFRGVRVPDVLRSGDHAAIRRWRREESLRLTLARRSDLLARAALDPADRDFLRTLGWRGEREG